ncbi:DUF3515 domain-containing protein [Gulosibacter macacae]|uniref:DUF3515 domain-containing protein n=1 Tax=Gulosibacter macacae TaxID=2488791 RepID=A0A3P3VTR7_9MICO|nr:DUF3515 domain-containing protein [Gulosibacter macacae]RRJ86185.1 DUF3515 domain-containing protein [Gulosibacter macacae]
MKRSLLTFPLVALLGIALSGCSGPSVPMQPAADAGNPICAEVSVRLPDVVDGLERRDTNAQATGAWGNPAAVLLRCGVPTPPPTTDRCISINGVDWVENSTEAPRYVYTTYGRTPAAEVVIDATKVSGTSALIALEEAIGYLPVTGGCVGPQDLEEPALDPTTTATP